MRTASGGRRRPPASIGWRLPLRDRRLGARRGWPSSSPCRWRCWPGSAGRRRRAPAYARRPRRRPGTLLRTSFSGWVDALFAPTALPTIDSAARAVRPARRRRGARGRRPRPDRCARRRNGAPSTALMWRLLGSPLTRADRRRSQPGGAVEPDPRRGADRGAAGVRARAPLRRAAVGQSRAAGLSRAARDGPRHGRAARPGVRDARRRAPAAVFRPARRAGERRPRPRNIRPGRRRRATMPSMRWPAALALPVATEPHLATFSAGRRLAGRNAPAVRPARRARAGFSRKSRSPARSRSFSSARRRRRDALTS